MINRSPNKNRSKILLGIIIVLAGLYLIFSPHGIVHYTRQKNEMTRLREVNAALALQNSSLQQEINRLKNDPTYLEEVARNKYGFLKKNEIYYEFPEKKKH
ncbi:MAG: hypothetical protein A2511_14765 [Deltaproteobacteria bacterium RIFOXYD12_FULL_50_9]|nr:MAG: hypothetical protein A2511_14765 [Deltaproteobacteria bacterium RIFOXYD12_FULL_50_9]